MANDLELLFQYETENINQVESCVKNLMKKAQYRKYKEIYQIDLNILKFLIKECDVMITDINNKIQKGGVKVNEILYLLIPNIN
jgi:hypothetical protein